MAINPAIATIISAKILENLNPSHVYADGCNKDYEGELKNKGDTLRITSFGRPTPADYTIGSTLTYERIRPAVTSFAVDQDSAWAIAEDEAERKLASAKAIDQLGRDGAWAFIDGSDQFLAFKMAADAAITTTGTQVGNGAGDDKAYDVIEQMLLDIKNTAGVQESDMHAFVPFWFMRAIRLDQRLTGFGTPDSRKTMRGEAVRELANVTIHETFNALNSAGTGVDTDGPVNTIIVCARRAVTWAELVPPEGLVQVIPSEHNRDNYDVLMRGRYIYGAGSVYPQLIAKCNVTKGE